MFFTKSVLALLVHPPFVHLLSTCKSEKASNLIRQLRQIEPNIFIKMCTSRRLQKELEDMERSNLKAFRELKIDEANMLKWQGLLVPEYAPYNKGAFKIEIEFPEEYPFKPPSICFKTRIYHPNVDEHGNICLPIIHADHWKPVLKVYDVIRSLIQLINQPEPEHPLRAEVAEEFLRDRKRFTKNAEEFTKKFAEKRPVA